MERYGIGQAVRRKEDQRFITGHGRYLDDVVLDRMVHAALLRSPHAHARIDRLETAAARSRPGVLAVFTGADWRADGLGGIPTRTPMKNRDGSPLFKPERPGLAVGRVRFVGDPVAMVVAQTPGAARDALEAIDVDYRPLPAVTDPVAALAPGSAQVWDAVPGNLCLEFEAGDAQAVARAFEQAEHRVSIRVINNRVTAVPLEPRGAIGCYDAGQNHYTLIATTQNVHANRKQIAEEILHIDAERLRLAAYDVGGGFGVKNGVYPEYALVLFAARRLQRPVKWLNDRSESFLSDTHGREQHSQVELALNKDGDFLALRVTSVGNVGAYLSTIGPFVSSGGSARTQGGPYRIPALCFRSRVAYTHTAPTDPYRGAGRPEATYVIERAIDVAAADLGLDPIALRRRNALRREDLPYRTPVGAEIDCGDFPAVLEQTLRLADRQGFAERALAAKAAGRRRGFGVALYFECTGGSPKEFAALHFSAAGGVELSVGSHSTGMGHETALAQIVAERLGVPFERISFRQGDTALTPLGGGHGGSRSLEAGGSAALAAADAVIEKARRIASETLEAAAEDLDFDRGRFTIAGTDRSLSLAEMIAEHGPRLDADAIFERANISYPNGCHIAEVEVDLDTGVIDIVKFSVVDDFGKIINPLLADGQVMGGAAQGIGQAINEAIVYDGDGQLLSASLMDYGLPRADDVPDFAIEYYEDAPTERNPLGVKGAGEAGCVGAPPAIVNAVVDALHEFGVRHIDMPLTPERVWRAIRAKRP